MYSLFPELRLNQGLTKACIGHCQHLLVHTTLILTLCAYGTLDAPTFTSFTQPKLQLFLVDAPSTIITEIAEEVWHHCRIDTFRLPYLQQSNTHNRTPHFSPLFCRVDSCRGLNVHAPPRNKLLVLASHLWSQEGPCCGFCSCCCLSLTILFMLRSPLGV